MLPLLVFSDPPEPLAASWDETECTPDVVRPGVEAFRAFVLKHQGGRAGSTWRPCGRSPSGHYSSRAWDWGMDANNPQERARVEELLDWLLEMDAEMFRRVGLQYVIWDRQKWRSYSPGWVAYDGYDLQGNCTKPSGCRDPHTNHVHFSFSKQGAEGATSFYGGRPAEPPPDLPTPPVFVPPPASPLAAAGATIGGFALGSGLLYLLSKSRF